MSCGFGKILSSIIINYYIFLVIFVLRQIKYLLIYIYISFIIQYFYISETVSFLLYLYACIIVISNLKLQGKVLLRDLLDQA